MSAVVRQGRRRSPDHRSRSRPGPPQSERSKAFEQRFDRSAELRPELNLTGNRALGGVRDQIRVEYELVGYLDRLTHADVVVFCSRSGKFLARLERNLACILRRKNWLEGTAAELAW